MFKWLSIPFLTAVLSGMAMAVQGTLNSQLTSKTSLLGSTLSVHVIGTLTAVAAVLFMKTPILKFKWVEIPWYYYLGGVLSVAIVALVAFSISKTDVSSATTAIIIGQVGLALFIDHLGLFGMTKSTWSPWQFLGLALFAAGAKLIIR